MEAYDANRAPIQVLKKLGWPNLHCLQKRCKPKTLFSIPHLNFINKIRLRSVYVFNKSSQN